MELSLVTYFKTIMVSGKRLHDVSMSPDNIFKLQNKIGNISYFVIIAISKRWAKCFRYFVF